MSDKYMKNFIVELIEALFEHIHIMELVRKLDESERDARGPVSPQKRELDYCQTYPLFSRCGNTMPEVVSKARAELFITTLIDQALYYLLNETMGLPEVYNEIYAHYLYLKVSESRAEYSGAPPYWWFSPPPAVGGDDGFLKEKENKELVVNICKEYWRRFKHDLPGLPLPEGMTAKQLVGKISKEIEKDCEERCFEKIRQKVKDILVTAEIIPDSLPLVDMSN